MTAPAPQGRAARRRAWHRARLDTATDPRHRVSTVGDYLRAVLVDLADLEPQRAVELADAHVEVTLELIEAHTANGGPW